MNLPKPVLIVVALALVVVVGCGSEPTGGPGTTGLVLDADGILPYVIGQPADEVIDGLSASIGGPDGDSSEPDAPLTIPDCGEPGVRVVSWGSLILFFVDRGGSSVFATWSYGFDPITGSADDSRGLGLTTEEGIGLGSSRDDLVATYGLRVEFDDDLSIDLSTFTIDDGRPAHLAGRMTSTDPDARVQFLERIPACEAG